tara:strand:+ start:455 stop:916 length:462 start_codon:yes stop_codon:yes gene_type:complete
MGMKKVILIFIFLNITIFSNAEIVKPEKKYTAFDVVKIQLTALKNNNNPSIDSGIRQVWSFAHPKNKKSTGPYERFRIMLYGEQYNLLLEHTSHKISLIMNTPNKYIYEVELLTKNKKTFFYEWHLEKGSEKNCNDCWFTSAVSMPTNQGNSI